MVKITKCDRCGKEVDKSETISFGCNSYDCCESCFTELMEFMFKEDKK